MTKLSPSYNHFIGFDIGKHTIDMAIADHKATYQYENTKSGWNKLFREHKTILQDALVIAEATGGYEDGILSFLYQKKVGLHRGNARNIKRFRESFGTLGKSDTIDAQMIARYAKERHSSLEHYTPPSKEHASLQSLTARREDLIHMRTQEKNRKQAPLSKGKMLISIREHITYLDQQIADIDREIKKLIDQSPELSKKRKIMHSLKGVKQHTSAKLLAALPELGTLSKKKIASLAGLAPHPNESGQKKGYRKVKGGRMHIKPILYVAAMAASRSHSPLGIFYQKLIANGKKGIVALTALMRKMIVILNARLREEYYALAAI